eukprot:JZ548295.1.p3 GENE.JZ548295.1~~JZ548295.1.p3  ORF type:complete len:140 (+),score=18.20 JZ548295.1:77-496(+)
MDLFADNTKIGIGLTLAGGAFMALGMMLFLDRALLALGNLLFVGGVAMTLGVRNFVRFFFQRSKLRASGFFFGGILIVIIGWPLVGMVMEGFGFVTLFGRFVPMAVDWMRSVPGLGLVLTFPGIKQLVSYMTGSERFPV